MAKKQLEVKGLKEINDMFASLPKQIKQESVWKKFWREQSKPFIKDAKSRVKQDTGQLKRSIGYFTTRASRKYLGGYVGPRVKGTYRSKEKTGFYGAFIEYGKEVKFWGKGFGKKNQPFMEPAWKSQKQTVLKKSMDSAIKVMAKAIKSHETRLKKYGKLGY